MRLSKKTLAAFLVMLPALANLGAESRPPAQTRWERLAEQRREAARDIVWPTHEPPEFLLRRGDHFEDDVDRYAQMCAPENIERMAAAGVRYGRLFFYKGFGLEYERRNIELAKQAARLMHDHGLKVDLYVGGTMFTETFYREVPQARDWEQRDQNGQGVPYGLQTFRHYACPNEPAYRDYLKRVLKIGVEELHADLITFDNVMLQPEPKSCRCARCQEAFRAFLRRKYPTSEAVRRRFGLPEVEAIRVNEWDSPTQPDGVAELNDPVLQEWVRFRCESLARHAGALYDYVKSLNPDVAVLFNIKGLYSFNRYWANAVYHPLYTNHIDLLAFDTGGYDARLDSDTGALVSQIRSYKVARYLGASCEQSLRDDLQAAVHMAFGYETPVKGYPGAAFMSGAVKVFSPIIEFFREYNQRYYTGADEAADVAVVRTWASMAYSINATHVPATLMEQVLIQHHIPFGILFDESFDDIQRYRAVILAGQECLSGAQVRALLEYARQGGVVIVAGNTGTYNEWRERRRANPLLPARREGRGQIIVIPEIVRADKGAGKAGTADEDPEPGATARKAVRLTPAQWVLPANHAEIAQAVAAGLRAPLLIQSDAPLTTVLSLMRRAATRETILHLVNFDGHTSAAPVKATIRKQFAGPAKSVRFLSPQQDEPAALPFAENGDLVTFTVPATKLYGMVVIDQSP
jgi:hypothetical protein